MIRQFELVERVKAYDPQADEDALNRGYVFAMKAHGAQTRANGDPYFSHPLEVAGILTDYRLDTASIVTALLHDTVEDTGATISDIKGLFGAEVARLVDGVTKLNRIELQSEHSQQAENFRKLVLAMSEDIRVLLVKFADRLHNMRTLKFLNDHDKRRRIAKETMEIYAPLAERMGMQELKNELEDLAFAELNPHARESIVARLKFLREQGGVLVPRIIEQLHETLRSNDLEAEIVGREDAVLDLAEDAAQQPQLRAVVRHHGVPRDRADAGGLLSRAGHRARRLPGDPRPLQGLHLDAEAERLPIAAHRRVRTGAPADRNPDPHPRDA